MRHKVAFRSLSRPTGHRMLMLRNLVSSLIEHDQITTTVAKAKETARLAEKLITLSKRSQKQFNKALLVANGIESSQPTANQLELQKRQDRHHKMQANQFLLNPGRTHHKLFNELKKRYQNRQRGFTRIHLFGHRKGDHAPTAVLELVDNPRDLKTALTATRVGRELANRALKRDPEAISWRTASSSSLSSSSSSPMDLPMHKFDKRLQRDIAKAHFAHPAQLTTEGRSQSLFEHTAHQSFDDVLGLRAFGPARPDTDKIDLQRQANADSQRDTPDSFSPPKTGRTVKAGQQPFQISKKQARQQQQQRQVDEDVMTSEEDWVDEEDFKPLSPMARANGVQRRQRRRPLSPLNPLRAQQQQRSVQ